jgi:hypothetical protein
MSAAAIGFDLLDIGEFISSPARGLAWRRWPGGFQFHRRQLLSY